MNITRIGKISKRPVSMATLQIHFALSGRGWNVPAGPIVSPNPGPTLDMVVAAADIAVIKSNPLKDSAIAMRLKLRA